MSVRSQEIEVTVAGSAGSATGSANGQAPLCGMLKAIYVDYTAQPATCDVTITSNGQAVLTLTNANTDGWFYPRTQIDDVAGAAISAQYDSIPIDDYISVAVAQGDAGSVTVKVLIES